MTWMGDIIYVYKNTNYATTFTIICHRKLKNSIFMTSKWFFKEGYKVWSYLSTVFQLLPLSKLKYSIAFAVSFHDEAVFKVQWTLTYKGDNHLILLRQLSNPFLWSFQFEGKEHLNTGWKPRQHDIHCNS